MNALLAIVNITVSFSLVLHWLVTDGELQDSRCCGIQKGLSK